MKSGFEATGICPLNSNRVLSKLPSKTADSSGSSSASSVLSDAVLDLLSEMRYGNKDKVEKRGRGKKVSVAAGKSHTHWEREQSSESEDDQAAAGDGEGDQAGPSVPSLSDRLDAIINNLLINQEYPDDESSEDNTSDEEY